MRDGGIRFSVFGMVVWGCICLLVGDRNNRMGRVRVVYRIFWVVIKWGNNVVIR